MVKYRLRGLQVHFLGVMLLETCECCERLMQHEECRMCRAGGEKKRKESFSHIMPSTLLHYVRGKLQLTCPSALGDFCKTQTYHPLHLAHLHNDMTSQSCGSKSVRMAQINIHVYCFYFFLFLRECPERRAAKMPKSCLRTEENELCLEMS